MKRSTRGGLAALATVGAAALAGLWFSNRAGPAPHAGATASPSAAAPSTTTTNWPTSAATYVGTRQCAECHEKAFTAYRGSDHDRAIEEPSREAVLAPFDGEAFVHDGARSTFVRRAGDFFVQTAGPSGKPADYRVAYTFGVRPLQQYLLDVGSGRLQAFTVAWDTRPANEGGQRYFDLYPDEELTPDNPLHWSGPQQNWNFTCADCHSTALRRGYDEKKDGFETTWAELDVGCEACHGPGSVHAAWAKAGAKPPVAGLLVSLDRAPEWTIPKDARSAAPRLDTSNRLEVEVCAPCHSRRYPLREGHRPDQPLLDAYRPELLLGSLYYDDGQIDQEVYVYGSFLQSRMFHAGVRCSDCHEPHSLALRRDGNDLCTGCHAKATYDDVSHHRHSGEGSACAACHMPAKTYMRVDPRRDHSLRIPRPDLAAAIGSPDPCTGCHENRTPTWAADKIREWFGGSPPPHYGATLHAARRREAGSADALAKLSRDPAVPGIVRATALFEFQNLPGSAAREALDAGAKSVDGLVRLGVAQGARGLSQGDRLEVLRPLLRDRLLAVRIEAARALSELPRQELSNGDRTALEEVLEELLRTERTNADRADAWLRIAVVELGSGHAPEAERALERALELDPRFTPAMVNLADLQRMLGKEENAEKLLRRAVELEPDSAEAWHALGLSLVRSGRAKEAIELLGRAAKLRPDNPRFAYVHAVALADGGDLQGAIAALRRALEDHPNDPPMLQALTSYAQQAGDAELAAEAAARLKR